MSQTINKKDQQSEMSLEILFERMSDAFAANPYPNLNQRLNYLSDLKRQLQRYQDLFATAISQDFGNRAHTESKFADILGPILDINHVRSHLKRWMKPSKRRTELMFTGNSLQVSYQPKGVVGVICPWNFPLFLSLGPMITALAAGNRVMIKMPPNCPNTTAVLIQMLDEIYPRDLVCIVAGDHPQAMEISHLPFNHLIFTGSPTSGKLIMANAAKNLTPVTLELGGKSPVVVFDDYSIEKAAERVAHGKGFNSGQICLAPDYALVPQAKVEAFVQAVVLAHQKMYPDIAQNDDYTSLVDANQEQRYLELLQDARDLGATITSAGSSNGKRQYPLQVVSNLKPEMRICQEEIFGPILPVMSYQNLDQVEAYINARPRPLAIYPFTSDQQRCDQLLAKTHSGGVTINDWGFHAFNHGVPFGGVGNSGMGNYHGEEGFRELSHARSILKMRPWFPIHLFTAPYNGALQNFILKLWISKADKNLTRYDT
ncbi:coniferyl aldehyde dehydrogenase [Alginatibacterium sediminis]|uniref:Aldehyde dehydrogenase n=1 Tax=Alginatibacterium sediminis TaxID=2164068 RepID=A0A420EBL1_9ALTE|nr:coniferyl aldehyde dehydrogenase [Alginatibacterium sediminis]RKF18022.1 coniferyl aldehyde dehydrogenase [Alginatibacterium sediminis]